MMRRRLSVGLALALVGFLAIESGCTSQEAAKQEAAEAAKITAPPPPGKPPLPSKNGAKPNLPHM
jgi:hypothetical protein